MCHGHAAMIQICSIGLNNLVIFQLLDCHFYYLDCMQSQIEVFVIDWKSNV